ncbi:conserved hypothetical protein [Coccidioides posadasii str. Silveira]|uniref:Uncharacterized protein n=1 Tax=Coccidioides posadasii (strain RMSCC 757 / Silveira) TaxID=443226 RepID=E9CT58_COCPS|nr:conserved hypothetical protein [Coccidioides posadasii str. Silveira]
MELPLCLIPPDLMVYNPSSDRAYIPVCVGIFLESASHVSFSALNKCTGKFFHEGQGNYQDA